MLEVYPLLIPQNSKAYQDEEVLSLLLSNLELPIAQEARERSGTRI